MEKVWEMNSLQKEFVELVANSENGVTLFELKMQGKEFKPGALNTLITKNILKTDEEKREYLCDVVYNGVVVGKTKKYGTVYRLNK